ncbi:MAG: hypothetical protein HUJ90_00030 [Bacteroidales bacterium]|nr:hypothetical protein [Bacteroidales bacterium]
MIDIKTTIHDKYSIEMKMDFVAEHKKHENNFAVGMWIFVPESLDITPNSFSKDEFYRCVKSNIRLKTPQFPLSEITGEEAIPFKNLQTSPETEYEYRLKIFCAITKSALRESLVNILSASGADRETIAQQHIACCDDILTKFFSLKPTQIHAYCGEFLCGVIANSVFSVMKVNSNHASAKALIKRIYKIRKENGYAQVDATENKKGRAYMHHQSVLKKMVESTLYLRVPKKRDGVIAEQAYFSIAAGMAMLFATVVAWVFQRTYGNLTWPLFIALIISYMMKDRIKELMRYYFAHKISNRYYDNKARMDIRGHEIGWMKEAMDFIPLDNVPADIDQHRNSVHLFSAENGNLRENVILYRKRIKLNKNALERQTVYDFQGINDIVRLQMRPFLHKMDNPLHGVYTLNEADEMQKVDCERNYYINIIMKYEYGTNVEFKRFRITLNRDGVQDLTQVE